MDHLLRKIQRVIDFELIGREGERSILRRQWSSGTRSDGAVQNALSRRGFSDFLGHCLSFGGNGIVWGLARHDLENATAKLRELLKLNLKTVRAYLLKVGLGPFWGYAKPVWAGRFLDDWCKRTMRTRSAPMKKVALMQRSYRPPKPLCVGYIYKGTLVIIKWIKSLLKTAT